MSRVDHLGIPILATYIVPKSAEMASRMNRTIPGVCVPDRIIERLADASNKAECAIEVSAPILKRLAGSRWRRAPDRRRLGSAVPGHPRSCGHRPMTVSNSTQPDEAISLRPARLPASESMHRPFLVASLSMATLVGFVLAIHVPLSRLLDVGNPERTADLIQAHGQVQLLGFAGLFVIGMSLRLMPRFASSHVAFSALVPVTLYLFAGGLVTRAIVMPWFSGTTHSVLLIASVFAVLLGSACFLLIVAGTLAGEARRFDSSSLAFIQGALLLFTASVATTFAAIDAVRTDTRGLPYLTDNAIVQLQLFGFLLSFILGVALRAIPTMVGVERPGRSAGWLAILLGASTAVLAGSLLYVEYVSYSTIARISGRVCIVLPRPRAAGAGLADGRDPAGSQPHSPLVSAQPVVNPQRRDLDDARRGWHASTTARRPSWRRGCHLKPRSMRCDTRSASAS